ncbi:N-acetylneuraminate synthase family protein [Actinophytocola xanthii]|uniref:N-acetylneuraminate synthase n=1 Tax=Actinophytocola xanthii TaxID=1912961 RepID=A0A1Q8CSB8_9PSEU|nr:N-acetylneuraminate synthase family protein [Actinophytocola xanthii]OLF17233.1 N-acetylneuraminate synthase [Actinophytocola xanthii]
MRKLSIAGRFIDDSTDAYVIAEIGHNHEGDLGKAEELVRAAAAAGASAAKLQKRDNRSLYTRAMYDEPYTGRNSYGPTYGAHREALEFGAAEYRHLAAVAADAGIHFISTAFDFPSVDFLVELGVPAIKMASGDLTNVPLLTYAAKAGIPLVISTGAADMADVRRAVDAILPINPQLAVLQCTAIYPAAPVDLNLSVIRTYRRELPEVVVGFSGHDLDLSPSYLAYALGARVIEKHVTLDRGRPGSDHHFSLEPAQLGELVSGLRRTREALGSPVKARDPRELPALRKMGKKLVAARPLPEGHVLGEVDILIKSPGDGTPPYLLDQVIGRPLGAPLAAEADITLDVLA